MRWTVFAALLMLAANLGSIVAEFAGIGAALGIFGIPPQISAAVAAVVVVAFIALGSYSRVQLLFVGVGVAVSAAYIFSAIEAKPDWALAVTSLVSPQLSSSPVYWLAVVGTVGTTITPWGQAFIQSYVVDKGLRPEDLRGSRVGRLRRHAADQRHRLLHRRRLRRDPVRERASRSRPRRTPPRPWPRSRARRRRSCSRSACSGRRSWAWASSRSRRAYTTCEAFGWETGVDWNWREAPAFYGLLAFFIGFAALFVMIPGLPLIAVMFSAQVLNALLLPFVLVFVMLLASDKELMGPLVSGRFLGPIGWLATALLVLLSLILLVSGLIAVS